MRRSLAWILTVLGGLVMGVGPLLPFVVADTPQGTLSYSGIAQEIGGDGWYFIGVGAALVVLGASIAWSRSATLARVLGAIGVLAAGLVAAVAAIDIVDIITLEEELPPEAGGLFSFSVGIGLYVAAAGSIVGLIGSGTALFVQPEAPPVQPLAGPPTGWSPEEEPPRPPLWPPPPDSRPSGSPPPQSPPAPPES
ncbi:MAG TPA: hypothetical protein VF058_06800 [Actinomycetota bacterium]